MMVIKYITFYALLRLLLKFYDFGGELAVWQLAKKK